MLINLTSDDAQANEEAMATAAGMKYVQLPMTTRVPPTPERVAEFLKIVADPGSQPVYVHCVGGRHRTGVMTAVYRMAQEGWSAEQAFKEMKHVQVRCGLPPPGVQGLRARIHGRCGHAAAGRSARPVDVQN